MSFRYAHEDGTYSAALQLKRGTQPPADVAEWQATLQDALPAVPKVVLTPRPVQQICCPNVPFDKDDGGLAAVADAVTAKCKACGVADAAVLYPIALQRLGRKQECRYHQVAKTPENAMMLTLAGAFGAHRSGWRLLRSRQPARCLEAGDPPSPAGAAAPFISASAAQVLLDTAISVASKAVTPLALPREVAASCRVAGR